MIWHVAAKIGVGAACKGVADKRTAAAADKVEGAVDAAKEAGAKAVDAAKDAGAKAAEKVGEAVDKGVDAAKKALGI